MDIRKNYLTINQWSRPGIALNGIKALIIHWEANPNTSALANRNYFENRKYGNTGYGAAQFIMDPRGFIIQCIPDWEMAYQVGSKTYLNKALRELSSYPNNCVVGIELPHIDWDGKMTNLVYNKAVEFCYFKLKEHGLTSNDLWLHQEVVGWKDCHRWMVNHPSDWQQFKRDVANYSGNRDYLIKDDRGSEVKELQEKLINLGYDLGSYGADGVYGNATVVVLKAFQRDNNLTVDGIYGQASQEKMKQVLQEKKGELTMSEYSELKDLINKQNGEIDELKDQLADKMDTTSSTNDPSDTHTDAWQWLINKGITDGTTPLHYITREQTGTMLKRYNENNEYLPNWMYDEIVDRFAGIAPYLHKPDEWEEKLSNHEIAVPELLGVFMLGFLNKENTDKALK